VFLDIVKTFEKGCADGDFCGGFGFWPLGLIDLAEMSLSRPQVLKSWGAVFGFAVWHPKSTSSKWSLPAQSWKAEWWKTLETWVVRGAAKRQGKAKWFAGLPFGLVRKVKFNLRVWSWLRTNAGGRL